MGKVALDASAILSWILAEPVGLGNANELMSQLLSEGMELLAPKLLILEILNVLVRRYRLPESVVAEMLERVVELDIFWIESDKFEINELIHLEYKHKLTSYDAWYLQVARQYGCQLITHDKALLKADKKRCITPKMFLEQID